MLAFIYKNLIVSAFFPALYLIFIAQFVHFSSLFINFLLDKIVALLQNILVNHLCYLFLIVIIFSFSQKSLRTPSFSEEAPRLEKQFIQKGGKRLFIDWFSS